MLQASWPYSSTAETPSSRSRGRTSRAAAQGTRNWRVGVGSATTIGKPTVWRGDGPVGFSIQRSREQQVAATRNGWGAEEPGDEFFGGDDRRGGMGVGEPPESAEIRLFAEEGVRGLGPPRLVARPQSASIQSSSMGLEWACWVKAASTSRSHHVDCPPRSFIMLSRIIRLSASWAAVALLVGTFAGSSAHAAPVVLSTPAGLNVGDSFRFVFVTNGQYSQTISSAGTINASSSDIGVYNTFVSNAAGGATYGGVAVTWKAVGSTATVDARDNVGGFNLAVPIFLVDGTRISNTLTTSAGGFWSAGLLGSTKLNLTIDGSIISSKTWTGTTYTGVKSTRYLGNVGDYVVDGLTTSSTDYLDYQDEWYADYAPMYGMSATLTVPPPAIPEPSTCALALAGLLCGAVTAWRRRQRS